MQYSRQVTRKSASNLAMAFVVLPRHKREGMAALYAFCREVDDVADEETVPLEKRREQLAAWRRDIRAACEAGNPEFQVNRELQPVIQRYGLPLELFEELIRGVEMDLDTHRYADFDALELYCYRVASVVGLLSIEIFGYQDPATREYAVHLGKALQLTNILRDVRTDAERGRIYLPQSELAKFDVAEEEILGFVDSDRFRQLARSVAGRARHHYRRAGEALPTVDRRSMVAAELMGTVYWRLLCKLEAQQFNVFDPNPARLGKPLKLFLIFRTWFRLATGTLMPNYGVA